jgi:hypothetical protein
MSDKFFTCDCKLAKKLGYKHKSKLCKKKVAYKVDTHMDDQCVYCDNYAVWYEDKQKRQWTDYEKNFSALGDAYILEPRENIDYKFVPDSSRSESNGFLFVKKIKDIL